MTESDAVADSAVGCSGSAPGLTAFEARLRNV